MNRRAFIRKAGFGTVAGISALAGFGAAAAVGPTSGARGANDKSATGAHPSSTSPSMTSTSDIDWLPAVQLYTVRTALDHDFEGTIAELADMGYRVVETAGLHGRDASDVREILDRHDLRCASGHYPFEAHEDEAERVVDTARALGQEFVVWPWIPEHYRSSREDYRRLADHLNEVGRRFGEDGIQLAYHNHDFEFERLGGDSPAYDILLEHTDPSLVTFELDVYWVYYGGYDPMRYIRDYPGRFALLHLKDGSATPERAMVDVGEGVIDFTAVLAEKDQMGMQYAYVEHDHPDDPMRSVRRGYDHIHSL